MDEAGAGAQWDPDADGDHGRQQGPLDSRPLAAPRCAQARNEGSSVGVAIVKDDSNYGNPIAREAVGPWQEFDRLLAEPFIKGRELTVAVLGETALADTELRVKSGFYDYDAKYTEGLTQHVCPADGPAHLAPRLKDLALNSHDRKDGRE